jgi:hypothetical protein
MLVIATRVTLRRCHLANLRLPNHDVHAEDGMRRLEMENQTAVPGDVGRSATKTDRSQCLSPQVSL